MKIALLGYGRMGKLLDDMILDSSHEIIEKFDTNNIRNFHKLSLSKPDVLIDFSNADWSVRFIPLAFSYGIPVISGTTGWMAHFNEVTKKCHSVNGSFMYASNFSIGVNILFRINRYLAKIMNHNHDYDVLIKEIHHVHKVDSPSGTAISLANDIVNSINRKSTWKNETSSESFELSILSERKDEIPGTHHIQYLSENDSIMLEHEAFNRNGFAAGALKAAEWIQGKKGVFRMDDMISL